MSEENAPAAHDLEIIRPSLHNMHVLKNRDVFSLFDASGDIPSGQDSPAGIFASDTRILSRWRFLLHAARLKFLSGGLDRDGVVMSSHVTNYAFADRQGQPVAENALCIHRDKFISNEIFYERIRVVNYGLTPAALQAELRFGSDFKDIFEVRGAQRARRGTHFDAAYGADHCTVTYGGLDGQERHCQLRFSRAPDTMTLSEAVFRFSLAPQEEWTLTCRVSAGKDAMPGHDYDLALVTAREEIEARAARWLRVRTDNALFDSWLEASLRAVCLLVTDMPSGPYPYAGIPWFSVPFGRDGIITALQVLHFNPGIARGVLRYLADTQAADYAPFREAEPGRILHETRMGEMARTGEVPYQKYYGSADSTPLFLMLAGAWHAAGGDMEFLDGLMPAIRASAAWLEKDGDRDGDGFIEYARQNEKGLFSQGWKDSHDSVFHADGTLAESPVALCEIQGYAYTAFQSAAALFEAAGEQAEAARLREKAKHLYERFNEAFWDDELDSYVLALDGHKKPCRVRASNAGHLLYCGIVPPDRAEKTVRMLMGPEFFSGWGIRTVGVKEARYSPLSYHNGSVWPHDTSIIAAGFARYGYYKEAARVLEALFLSAQKVERMLLPELICGFQRVRDESVVLYPTACLPQAWSSAACFMALSAALGLETRDGALQAAHPEKLPGLFQTLEIRSGERTVFSI